MNKRVQLYLDDESFEYLKKRCELERRKPGNLATLWVIERIQAEKINEETQNTQK